MSEWPDRVGWAFVYERIIKRPDCAWAGPRDDVFVLAELRTDRLRPAERPDRDTVAEYEAVGPGNMPPIVVNGALRVIDGSHRLAAAQRRGDETIRAYVLTG